MGSSFEDHMELFLKGLFNQLFIKIKIITSSTEDCIRELLATCHCAKSLGALLMGAADPHKEVPSLCR